MDRVLITGGSGYVGARVVAHLARRGEPLRLLVHEGPVAAPGAEVVRGDVRYPRPEWFEGVRAVIHLAACTRSRRPRRYFEHNALATARLVDAVRTFEKPPLVVFASSIAATGPGRSHAGGRADGRPRSEPVTSYGLSKLLAERALETLPRWVALRLPMVYGTGDRSLTLLRRLVRLGVAPTSAHRFSGICVDDVALLIAGLLDRAEPPNAVCTVSDGESYSFEALADHLARVAPLLRVPVGLPGLAILAGWALGNPDLAAYVTQDWLQPMSDVLDYRPRFHLYELLGAVRATR